MGLHLTAEEARRLARVTEVAIRGALGQSISNRFTQDIQDLKDHGHTLQFAREYTMHRLAKGYHEETHDPLDTVQHCPHATLIGQGVRCRYLKQTQPRMPEPDVLLVELVEHIGELRKALSVTGGSMLEGGE